MLCRTEETTLAAGIVAFGVLAYGIPNVLLAGGPDTVSLFDGAVDATDVWQLSYGLGITLPPFAAGIAALVLAAGRRPIGRVLGVFVGAGAAYGIGLVVIQTSVVGVERPSMTAAFADPVVLTDAGLFATLAALCGGLGYLIDDIDLDVGNRLGFGR